MFDVTVDEIADLPDEDVAMLVGKLCVAELGQHGVASSFVRSGGHHLAADGGIDVRVVSPIDLSVGTHLKRRHVGFQAKLHDLQPAGIVREMRPGGTLRPAISELIRQRGSYVIVSARASVSGVRLQSRLSAMGDAVADEDPDGRVHLDYVDGPTLAAWTSEHPGLVLWVKDRLGQGFNGWRPAGVWSRRPVDAPFLLDDEGVFLDTAHMEHGELATLTDGLEVVRASLGQPGSAVRLIGLSGVGKTRFAEALFEEDVGGAPLDATLAHYCDMGTSPDPDPHALIARLVTERQRAIVVVDNCNPAQHRTLAAEAARAGSSVSLLTIEYDVRDDTPEETSVFRLRRLGDDVVRRLLEQRYPGLGQVDRDRIAMVAGGNARVALAVAASAPAGGTARLTDAELFERIFRQAHDPSDGLLRAARALSLVYSFDGETMEGEGAELPLLAKLASMSADELFGHVEELREREVIQARGQWRAVLPQPIALRLSGEALRRVPQGRVIEMFITEAPDRLRRSFVRQLGSQHDNEKAQAIAAELLAEGGRYGDLEALSATSEGVTSFERLAPAAPRAALAAIARFTAAVPSYHTAHTLSTVRRVLLAVAYEPSEFAEAVRLLVRTTVQHEAGPVGVREGFEGLFSLYLSGTMATPGERLAVIAEMAESDEEAVRGLAVKAIEEVLRVSHFTSSRDFSFGSRQRSYGWQPKTFGEIAAWYGDAFRQFLPYLEGPLARELSSVLATRLLRLMQVEGGSDVVRSATLDAVLETPLTGPWFDGWRAARIALRPKTANGLSENVMGKLRRVEAMFAPRTLADRVRAEGGTQRWSALDVRDDEDLDHRDYAGRAERALEAVKQVGRNAVAEGVIDEALLRELSDTSFGQAYDVARGMMEASDDRRALWRDFVNGYAATPPGERNLSALRGACAVLADRAPDLADELLERAIDDPILGPVFPAVQNLDRYDARALARLERSVRAAPEVSSRLLGRDWSFIEAPAEPLASLLGALAGTPEGASAGVAIIAARLHNKEENRLPDPLMRAARDLLPAVGFDDRDNLADAYLEEVARAVLFEPEAEDTAVAVVHGMLRSEDGVRPSWRLGFSYGSYVAAVFEAHPVRLLTEVFAHDFPPYHLRDMFCERHGSGCNALDAVPAETLIAWADEDAERRYAFLIPLLRPLGESPDDEPRPLNPQLVELASRAPQGEAVSDALTMAILPTSLSGDFAAIYDELADAAGAFEPESAFLRVWRDDVVRQLRRQADYEREEAARRRTEVAGFE